MRWPREMGLWLTLAVLALLLVLLAALQYRWIGEIGRAETERRTAAIERGASRFAFSLARAFGQIMLAFRVEPGSADDPATELRRRLAAWSSDERAPLVSRVLLASHGPTGDVMLQECLAVRCTPVPWTPALERLRLWLRPNDERPDAGSAFPPPPDGPGQGSPGRELPGLVENPLALVLPLVGFAETDPSGARRGQIRTVGVVMLELDVQEVRDRILARQAEVIFGPEGESECAVAVVRRTDRSLVWTNDSAIKTSEPHVGDFQLPLFGLSGRGGLPDEQPGSTWRPGVPPPRQMDRPPGPGEGPPPDRRSRSGFRPPLPRGETDWLLVLRHRGGSLEHAVAAVRQRNLAVGLGLLALLGITAVVLVRGARRARRLAEQQIEFVTGVTHELNTPLAAIRSAGQNLADGIVTQPESVRRYGDLIEKEGARLTTVVAQILDFAGIASGLRVYAADPVAIDELVDATLGSLRLVLDQAGLTLHKDVPAGLPLVRGDAAALRRVLANLLTNAAKFAASGRWVAVRAKASPDGRSVALRVEDGGPGIPAAERSRVFQPFYRGAAAQRNETPGSGLGLSLVRHVVRAHGGRVHVEGRAEGGTTVVVELPTAASLEKEK